MDSRIDNRAAVDVETAEMDGAMAASYGFTKRLKERQRQEKQREKQLKRKLRREQRAASKMGGGESPDAALDQLDSQSLFENEQRAAESESTESDHSEEPVTVNNNDDAGGSDIT